MIRYPQTIFDQDPWNNPDFKEESYAYTAGEYLTEAYDPERHSPCHCPGIMLSDFKDRSCGAIEVKGGYLVFEWKYLTLDQAKAELAFLAENYPNNYGFSEYLVQKLKEQE